ncbi:MAG: hypothetical protein ACYTE5_03555, partial [Planctomycetota bacterium]
MKTNKTCAKSGCPLLMNRRGFLTTASAMALAAKMSLFDFASSLFGANSKPAKKPLVRVAFVRPNVDSYWMGWPGATYNIKQRQSQYTKILTDAAKKLGVDLRVMAEPLHSPDLVST